MNKPLNIKTEEQDLLDEVREVSAKYPAGFQDDVREAFLAANEGDYEKAERHCVRLLDCAPESEIRMLLGICYFMQGKMQGARLVFADLLSDYPEEKNYLIYLGIADHALGRFEEAVKELEQVYPLSVYHPFYYTSYGDCLLQTGKLKQSRDMFYEEAAFFAETGRVDSPVMLDGAFQNLLYLDITLGNGQYPKDVQLYYDFLDQTEMTEEMQECLAGNIVYFCGLMSNKWYRPLFLEFITHIKDQGYLTTGGTLETLKSAFASWESFSYHEDRKISSLMETYLNASYERKYTKKDTHQKDEIMRIDVTALSYDWYMCQYAPEHLAELDYIREKYPYTYADNRDFFEEIKDNPEKTAERLIDELYPYVEDTPKDEFVQSMYRMYRKACKSAKEPVYVYDGEDTYRRIQPKIGRNDPCPCGSGKKYKKCCGR